MYACIRTLLYNRADIGYLLLLWPLCRIFAVAAIISIQTLQLPFRRVTFPVRYIVPACSRPCAYQNRGSNPKKTIKTNPVFTTTAKMKTIQTQKVFIQGAALVPGKRRRRKLFSEFQFSYMLHWMRKLLLGNQFSVI